MTRILPASAVLVIDFINEMIHPDGKLSGKGYAEYCRRHDTVARVSELIQLGRSANARIIFVRVCYSDDYSEHPSNSPLLGGARKFGALLKDTWATEFHDAIKPTVEDVIVEKHRVSAFFGTKLELVLRTLKVESLYVAGVATDLAVQSAVRDAHDRDFGVTVVTDCCAAASDDDHQSSLKPLGKLATVCLVSDLQV